MIALIPLMAMTQAVTLQPGLIIDRSCTVAKGDVLIANPDNDAKTSAITIKGDGIIVDFADATLRGTAPETEPDKRVGTGIIVSGKNITIKNLNVRGYKLGLYAKDCPNLKIVDSDFSYNWKQRLGSTIDREDSADWMSYHKNEKDEWFQYGAGVYLRNCDEFELRGLRIIGGQNGVMITDCDRGRLWNSNLSFLSSLGLGMYNSSDNRIMHNNIDWCVRGYSHGKWNRGQDSAGILIYEQSMRNVFAYNSVTHGGDGFFLWAGQTTMDNASGGCNDNFLYGNDFSHAPTNGIEATFSRNKFVNNLLMECWHGIWGGYSYNSEVRANVFAYNGQGIAWEHGQDNTVAANIFFRDTEGVVLWMNKTQDPNWGYPKNRDTKSRDWLLRANEFNNIVTNSVSLKDTGKVTIAGNTFVDSNQVLKKEGETPDLIFKTNKVWAVKDEKLGGEKNVWEVAAENNPMPMLMHGSGNVVQGLSPKTKDYLERFDLIWAPYPTDKVLTRGSDEDAWLASYSAERKAGAPKPLTGGKRPFIPKGQLRGRRFILVDEWGPYDFKRPILWPRGDMVEGKQTFEVLGPKGVATVDEMNGLTITATSTDGATWTMVSDRVAQVPVPSFVQLSFPAGKATNVSLQLQYRGQGVTDYRGISTPAGQPFKFGWSKFVAPIDWKVSWYKWDRASVADPHAKMPALADLIKGEPLKTIETQELNFGWGGAPFEGGPADAFATIANGTVELPAGDYILNVTTDDGCRVWIDDKLVIEDAWKYQGPTLYSREIKLGGLHMIRVEHYEIDGYAALKFELKPK